MIAIVLNTNNLKSNKKDHDGHDNNQDLIWYKTRLFQKDQDSGQNDDPGNQKPQKLFNSPVPQKKSYINERNHSGTATDRVVNINAAFEIL